LIVSFILFRIEVRDGSFCNCNIGHFSHLHHPKAFEFEGSNSLLRDCFFSFFDFHSIKSLWLWFEDILGFPNGADQSEARWSHSSSVSFADIWSYEVFSPGQGCQASPTCYVHLCMWTLWGQPPCCLPYCLRPWNGNTLFAPSRFALVLMIFFLLSSWFHDPRHLSELPYHWQVFIFIIVQFYQLLYQFS